MDRVQVERIAKKAESLVDSGKQIQLSTQDALRNLRLAEAEAAKKRREKIKGPFRRLMDLLFFHHDKRRHA